MFLDVFVYICTQLVNSTPPAEMLLIIFSVASNLTRWNFESPSKWKCFKDILGNIKPLITFFRLFLPPCYGFHNTGN